MSHRRCTNEHAVRNESTIGASRRHTCLGNDTILCQRTHVVWHPTLVPVGRFAGECRAGHTAAMYKILDA